MARRNELSYALTADSLHRRRRPIPRVTEEARNDDETVIQRDNARSCRRCRGPEPRDECLGPADAGQAVSTGAPKVTTSQLKGEVAYLQGDYLIAKMIPSGYTGSSS